MQLGSSQPGACTYRERRIASIVTIVLFHRYLSPIGTEIAFMVLALELVLAYRSMLSAC